MALVIIQEYIPLPSLDDPLLLVRLDDPIVLELILTILIPKRLSFATTELLKIHVILLGAGNPA